MSPKVEDKCAMPCFKNMQGVWYRRRVAGCGTNPVLIASDMMSIPVLCSAEYSLNSTLMVNCTFDW